MSDSFAYFSPIYNSPGMLTGPYPIELLINLRGLLNETEIGMLRVAWFSPGFLGIVITAHENWLKAQGVNVDEQRRGYIRALIGRYMPILLVPPQLPLPSYTVIPSEDTELETGYYDLLHRIINQDYQDFHHFFQSEAPPSYEEAVWTSTEHLMRNPPISNEISINNNEDPPPHEESDPFNNVPG